MRLYRDVILIKRANGSTYVKEGVTVTVWATGTTNTVDIYSTNDTSSTVITASQVFTDTDGEFEFYAPDGIYDLYITGEGLTAYTISEVEVDDVTKAVTSTERDALTAPTGLLVYNTTTNKYNFYNGTAWEVITSATV